MQTIHLLAPAKINVYLRITGRRADGYHLIESLMIPISLCDELYIGVERRQAAGNRRQQLSVPNIPHPTFNTRAEAADGEPRIVLTCDDPAVPEDETNLAYKAAALLMKEAGAQARVSIRLQKRIPAGAGLGGGSSDAAAVLKGLNTLLQLGLTEARLCDIGARLGADVPFFIPCRPAHVAGIGEILTPVPPLAHRWIVLVAPPFGVSTPWAYRRFEELPPSPSLAAAFAEVNRGQWPAQELFINDLERAVLPAYPQITVIKSTLLTHGAEGALMSGSGSSVFGIFHERRFAENARNNLQAYGKVFLVEPLSGSPLSS
jgi:4-diphosphocytidyl-2-C-methyl-D-erythritol kinase